MKILLTSIALAFLAVSSYAQQPNIAKPAQTQTAAEATPTTPAHPITADQTRELFELAGTKSMMEQMIHRTLSAQRLASPPYIPAAVWSELEENFLKIDFAQLLLPTYQKYLSEEDASQALAFYRTPAGKHFLAVVPQVMMEASEVGQKEGQRIASEILERHQQEIFDAKKKYDEQQNKPAEDQQQAPSPENKPGAAKPEGQK